ncbi:MAG: hypothetical protein WCP81_11110 [Actinomycetes bacterium]
MTQAPRRLTGVTSWSSISQAASAGSNVVIELAITVFIGLAGLGQWTVRYAALITVLYVVRAAFSDVLLADDAPTGDIGGDARTSSLLGLVLAIAVVAFTVFAVIAGLTHDLSWLIVGLALPAVLAQDLLRYIGFWSLNPRMSATLDLIWLGVSLLSVIAIASTRSVTVAIAAWGLGAVISVAWGLHVTGLRPRSPSAAMTWWQANRKLGIPTLLDTSLYLLGNQGLWFFVAAAAGTQTLGVLRLALLLANPALLVYLAAQTVLVPTITREGANATNLAKYVGFAIVAGLALFFAASLIVLPILRHVGAVTAPISTPLIWLTACYVAASAPYVITASLLRAKRHGRGFLSMRAIATALTLLTAVVGVQSWGASAALAGLALGTACAAAIGLWLSTKWLGTVDQGSSASLR